MKPRKKLLILSFSPIAGDARVLKQLALFAGEFDITSYGYGPRPAGVARHVEIPSNLRADSLDGRLITLRLYSRAYWTMGGIAWVRAALQGEQYDAVIANDVETVPLAFVAADPSTVHVDLHEYSPRLHEEFPEWLRRIKPFYDWLCRRYVSKGASWTTVSNGLAAEYNAEFGFLPSIVTNAAPYAALEPVPTGETIRLVHSGACLRNRDLMLLIDAVEAARTNVTLDFYLTPNDPPYLEELKARAANVPGVSINPPVAYENLVSTLHSYDLGVFVLAPVNFSYKFALPNKLFDYVQARLGMLVGPSPEMRDYVERYQLGVVTDSFAAAAVANAIVAMTPAQVDTFKASAHAFARELSAESQVDGWKRAVTAIVTEKR